MEQIFNKYNTDKNSYFHNYTRQYEPLLKDYRDKNIKYLEIGVYKGDSIKAMREYLSNSQCILGLDINDTCKEYEDKNNNIFVEIGDATKKEFITFINEKYGTFDIILDDGSHINRDIIKSFELLFPLLNDNGIYIIEDVNCYNTPYYVDINYQDHLNYFSQYIIHLNEGNKQTFCADPYKLIKKTNNVFEYSIDKIEFGCSYIAIHKKIRHHWI